jgi:hypothetical protein
VMPTFRATSLMPIVVTAIGFAVAVVVGGAYWLSITDLKEPFAVSLLYRFGDDDYLPMIYAIARGKFTEFAAYGLVGSALLPFPVVSSAPYSVSVALFGDHGFVFADTIISALRFAACLLLARAFTRDALLQACAALMTFVLTGPVLYSDVIWRLNALGMDAEHIASSWLMRYPRPYVTGIFVILLLVTCTHLTRSLRRKEDAAWISAGHGVALAMAAQGDFHLALIGCLGTAVAFVQFVATDVRSWKSALKSAAQVAVGFAIAILPMIFQVLSVSAEVSARWGLFAIPRSSALEFVDVDRWQVGIALAGATAWWILRRHGDERAESLVLTAVCFYAASLVALPVSIALLGKSIQIYHFRERSQAFATILILVIVFAAAGVAGRALQRKRWALRTLQAGFVLAAMLAASLQIRSSFELAREAASKQTQQRVWRNAGWEPLPTYRTDLAGLIEELERPEYRKALTLGTFDQQLAMWWLTRDAHTLWIPDTFVSTAADAVIEKRTLELSRLTGMPPHTFAALIAMERSYFTMRFLTLGKWQASAAYVAAPIADYSPDQQARIRNTDRYNPWAIRLPISERNRLLQHFAAIESTGTPIDLIVLADTIDFAGLPGPPAEQFRPVFSNASFRVWIRR